MKEEVADIYDAVKAHGEFNESPRERAFGLFLDMISNPTLPNITLGAFMTGFIQWQVGLVPRIFVIASGLSWIGTVILYAVGDEVRSALEAASRELEMDEQSDAPYQ